MDQRVIAGIGNILILFSSSLKVLGTGTILDTPVVVATQTLFCESIARPFTFGPARPSLWSKSVHCNPFQ